MLKTPDSQLFTSSLLNSAARCSNLFRGFPISRFSILSGVAFLSKLFSTVVQTSDPEVATVPHHILQQAKNSLSEAEP